MNLSTDADSSTNTKKGKICQKVKEKKEEKRQFYALFEQKVLNLRQILSITFPKGSPKYKRFGYWTSRSGGQKTFN